MNLFVTIVGCHVELNHAGVQDSDEFAFLF